MKTRPTCHIVAAEHPSLDREVDQFLHHLAAQLPALDAVASIGAVAADRSPNTPALVRALTHRSGFRLAAIEGGTVVGLARVSEAGELHVAVDTAHRRRGVGTALGRAALERAIALDYGKIVMRSRGRHRAARAIGESLGCVVVEQHRRRAELVAHLPVRRSA